jgi:hypothetical protein
VTADEREFVVVRVRDGELVDSGNWVYAWVDADGDVVYVGATGLDPETRVWLHLHDPDPEIGRMGARFAEATTSPFDVLAMRVPEELSRADVRDVLGARLADEGLLAENALTDHPQLVLDAAPEVGELADRYLARLRVYLEQRDPALL